MYLSNHANLMSSFAAVPLLGHDDVGLAQHVHLLGLLAGMIHFLAVDEHDHVGVLLDGPRLAEVAQPGTMALLAHLHLPVQLGQAQQGDVQLAGEALQPPGHLGHLLLARVARIVRLDQLQVVDHQEAEVLLPLQPPGAGGDFRHRAGRRVVDEDRRLAQVGRGLDQLLAVLAGKETAAELVGVDAALRAQATAGPTPAAPSPG